MVEAAARLWPRLRDALRAGLPASEFVGFGKTILEIGEYVASVNVPLSVTQWTCGHRHTRHARKMCSRVGGQINQHRSLLRAMFGVLLLLL